MLLQNFSGVKGCVGRNLALKFQREYLGLKQGPFHRGQGRMEVLTVGNRRSQELEWEEEKGNREGEGEGEEEEQPGTREGEGEGSSWGSEELLRELEESNLAERGGRGHGHPRELGVLDGEEERRPGGAGARAGRGRCRWSQRRRRPGRQPQLPQGGSWAAAWRRRGPGRRGAPRPAQGDAGGSRRESWAPRPGPNPEPGRGGNAAREGRQKRWPHPVVETAAPLPLVRAPPSD